MMGLDIITPTAVNMVTVFLALSILHCEIQPGTDSFYSPTCSAFSSLHPCSFPAVCTEPYIFPPGEKAHDG